MMCTDYTHTHKRRVPAATRRVPAASSNTDCALCLQEPPGPTHRPDWLEHLPQVAEGQLHKRPLLTTQRIRQGLPQQ